MKGTIELQPDQMAQVIEAVFANNGYSVFGLALYKQGQMVDYDSVVVHYNIENGIAVYPPHKQMTRKQLTSLLYPETTEDAGTRIGVAAT